MLSTVLLLPYLFFFFFPFFLVIVYISELLQNTFLNIKIINENRNESTIRCVLVSETGYCKCCDSKGVQTLIYGSCGFSVLFSRRNRKLCS
jgi:hypothetical protein